MFSLLKGLWNYLFKKEQVFVLIVGLDNAGKTTYLEHVKRLFGSPNAPGVPFDKITPTVGMNIGHVYLAGMQVTLWDLGGQEDLRTLWDKYYTDCHGLIYIVDSSDPEHLELSKTVLGEVLSHEALTAIPLLVLANKQDREVMCTTPLLQCSLLEDALPLTRIEHVFDSGCCTVGDRDYRIHQISALKGSGMDESLQWLVERSKEMKRQQQPSE